MSFFVRYYYADQAKVNVLGGICNTLGNVISVHGNVSERHEVVRQLGRPERIQEERIKVNLK
jgi:hypothetical protein